MSTTIPQRDLRNHNAQIIDRVQRGESFTVTRDGVPIADLRPHESRTRPPRFRDSRDATARTRLAAEESARWQRDIDALADEVDDVPRDPWDH